MKKKTAKTKPGKGSAPEKGHRPASPELIAKLNTWARVNKLQRAVVHGKAPALAEEVVEFLHAVTGGTYAIPRTLRGFPGSQCAVNPSTGDVYTIPQTLKGYCVSESGEAWKAPQSAIETPVLVETVLSAIRDGDAKTLRNLAAAVERVYARADVTGGKLTFKPAKPGKLATLANAQKSGTVKVSGKDIAAPGISERTAQRIARIAGAKPAKPGRKKKHNLDTPEPRKKPDTAAALHREVESGAKAFWAKRKRKK
jgi:hypothetical protein